MSATGIRWVYSVLDIRAGGSSHRAADGSADLSTTQQLSSSIFLLLLQTAGGTSHNEQRYSWQLAHFVFTVGFIVRIVKSIIVCLFVICSSFNDDFSITKNI